MHNGHWHDGGTNWWWIPMVIMMVAFWAGLAWVVVSVVRHNAGHRHHQPFAPPAPQDAAPRPRPPVDPRQILAERLAHGEIDVDDYHARLRALDASHPAG